MTLLEINLTDVLSETDPDDRVVVWAPAFREGSDGRLVGPRRKSIPLVDGVGSDEVVPGPLMVQVQCKGIADTKPREVVVPEAGPVTLTGLLDSAGAFTYAPPVIGQVALDAQRAEDAADSAETVAAAFGSLEGVQAAVDGAASSAAAAAGSATAAADSATAAAASETAAAGSAGSAAGDAASATASEGAASAAATNAASSETAAADHSSDAQDAATAAASSATAAAGSATDAAGSATAAAGSATDAGDAAVRAETAAENAELGIAPDSVLRTMLEPAIRLELDGLRTDVDGVSSSWSGITDKPASFPPEGHDHPAVEISDSSVVGRSVLTAVDAAAARLAIGAGTSSLALGTTSTTAKVGDWKPAAADITDATTVGRNVLKAVDAATARTAIGAGTSNLALGATSSTAAAGNHTHSQYVTITALESRTPEIRVVSTIPTSPTPGVVYLRFG